MRHGRLTAVEELTLSGVDVNAVFGRHVTSVYLAAQENQPAALELLIKAGANITIPTVRCREKRLQPRTRFLANLPTTCYFRTLLGPHISAQSDGN